MYGIDTGDRALMRSRPWGWLLRRIEALLSRPPLFDMAGTPRFTTRIQAELWQPATPPRAVADTT